MNKVIGKNEKTKSEKVKKEKQRKRKINGVREKYEREKKKLKIIERKMKRKLIN